MLGPGRAVLDVIRGASVLEGVGPEAFAATMLLALLAGA
jgi:hypothetical protein